MDPVGQSIGTHIRTHRRTYYESIGTSHHIGMRCPQQELGISNVEPVLFNLVSLANILYCRV